MRVQKGKRSKAMNRRVFPTICLITLFSIVFLAASDSFAEKTLVFRVGEEPRCENLTLSGRPTSGGYKIENIWVQREGIVAHAFSKGTEKVCFSPLRVGSTRVKISGKVFAYKPNGKREFSKTFFRNFRIRVRPAEKSAD